MQKLVSKTGSVKGTFFNFKHSLEDDVNVVLLAKEIESLDFKKNQIQSEIINFLHYISERITRNTNELPWPALCLDLLGVPNDSIKWGIRYAVLRGLENFREINDWVRNRQIMAVCISLSIEQVKSTIRWTHFWSLCLMPLAVSKIDKVLLMDKQSYAFFVLFKQMAIIKWLPTAQKEKDFYLIQPIIFRAFIDSCCSLFMETLNYRYENVKDAKKGPTYAERIKSVIGHLSANKYLRGEYLGAGLSLEKAESFASTINDVSHNLANNNESTGQKLFAFGSTFVKETHKFLENRLNNFFATLNDGDPLEVFKSLIPKNFYFKTISVIIDRPAESSRFARNFFSEIASGLQTKINLANFSNEKLSELRIYAFALLSMLKRAFRANFFVVVPFLARSVVETISKDWLMIAGIKTEEVLHEKIKLILENLHLKESEKQLPKLHFWLKINRFFFIEITNYYIHDWCQIPSQEEALQMVNFSEAFVLLCFSSLIDT